MIRQSWTLLALSAAAFLFAPAAARAQASTCGVGNATATAAAWASRDDDCDGVLNGVDDCPYEPDSSQAKAADGVTGLACQMQAITVPWVSTNLNLPHLTYSGRTVTLKGIARYGAPTQFMWNYGDGSTPMSWTNISGNTCGSYACSAYNLGARHAYTGNVGQLYIATLSVRNAAGTVATAVYPVAIQQSATLSNSSEMDVRVAVAEDEGLWWLHATASRGTFGDGLPGQAQRYQDWSGNYQQADACAALDAFQLHGSKLTGTYDSDPYIEDAQRTLAYVLYNSTYAAVATQNGTNNPNQSGDGHGVYLNTGGDSTYTDGICGAAFASTGAPGLVALNGPTGVFNHNYFGIMQDIVDWFAYSQNSYTGVSNRYYGGWIYNANSNSADGSTNQWPIVVMEGGIENMGVVAPAFVAADIPNFLNTIHYVETNAYNKTPKGSSYYGAYGYQQADVSGNNGGYGNVAKTSGGIMANFFIGNGNTNPAVEAGLGFIYTHWSDPIAGWNNYNLGDSYAMYDVMKAMSSASPKITQVVQYNSVTATQTANSFDWYYSYNPNSSTGWVAGALTTPQQGLASYLTWTPTDGGPPTQASNGSWTDLSNNNGLDVALDTAWDVLILERAVTKIPPNAAICNCAAQWPVNTPVTLDGTCSTEPDQTKAIASYQWDYNYNGTTFVQSVDQYGFPVQGPVVTDPNGFGQYTELLDGGALTPPVAFPVALQVTDNTGLTSMTICDVIIKPPPHCPQASAGGPYLGSLNKPVQLSAAASTQVDGDPLTYIWDFTNTNNFLDGGSSTLINPTTTYPLSGTYPIEVQVTNHPPVSDAGVTPGCSVVAYTTVQVGAHAPIASAGGPYTGVDGEVVTLDGSGSSDPDGDAITYAWDLSGSGVYTAQAPDPIHPTFTVGAAAAAGTSYSVCVKVTDATESLSAVGCSTVLVIAAHAAPTCAVASTNINNCNGGAVAVTADGSHSYDSEHDSFTYSWAITDGGPAVFSSTTTSMPTLTFQTAAEGCQAQTTATLTVANNYGSNSCSQLVTINDNQTPAFGYAPQNTTIECNSGAAAAVNTWLGQVRASEACASAANPVTIANSFIPGVGCGGLGSSGTYNNTISVTWTAIDPCNSNAAQTSATLTVHDTTAPVLTLPANETVEATSPAGAQVSYTATALDAAAGPATATCTPSSGSTFPLGVNTVSCTTQDPTGNFASGSFTITVQDTTPPAVSVPANKTVEAASAAGATALFVATSSDIVDGSADIVSCVPASGSVFALGTTTVVCTATDAHHNTGSNSFTVLVQDTTPPLISVPANKTIEATSPAGAAVVFSATSTDAVDGTDVVACLPASGSVFALGVTTVVCTATDAHNNTGSNSFTILVQDTTPPAISVPANQTLEATSAAGAVATFAASATDAVDGADVVTCLPASGGTFALGTTPVTCTATDAHHNTGSNTFTILVRDTTPPAITVPANQVLEATSSAGATSTFSATATDAVDGTDVVTCVPASGSTFALGLNTVTCSSTDAHHNSATNTFTIAVHDTTPPVVSVPANKTIEATSAAGATVTFSATSSDAVDGTDAATCVPASGSVFALGATTVTCSATDAHHNTGSSSFTILVQDTTPPLVSVPANKTIEATSSAGATVAFSATSSDAVDGSDAVACLPASGSVFALGTTTVTCTATDAHNNTGSNSFTVLVQDTTPPVVTVPANKTIEATSAAGAVVSFSATSTDAVDGTDAVACVPASGSVFALGLTSVTCTAADAHNNTGINGFTVLVQDTTPPAVAVPANKIVEATSSAGATVVFSATSADAVDGTDAVACLPASGSTFALGTTSVTCSATDAHHNTGNNSFTILVQDTTAPVVSVPANQTIEATSAAGATVVFNATAADAVDVTDAVTCLPSSGSTFALGTTTVTCTATDAHHNTGSNTFTVLVHDTTPPVLALPANQLLEATSAAGATASFSAAATDIVDGSSDAVTCAPASGSTFALGVNTITCTATDASNNTASGTFTVTVQDTTPPSFTGVPDGITLTYEATSAQGVQLDAYSFNGNDLAATDIVDGTDPVVCSPALPNEFALGATSVSCTATDVHNNQSNLGFNIQVVDTTPPVITCPANLTVTANGPLGAVNLNVDEPTSDALAAFFSSASALDLVDPMPTLSNHAPWLFPPGQTAVIFTATDASQNSASCTAQVTVVAEPEPAPALACPEAATISQGNGAEIDWTAAFRHPVEVELVLMAGANIGNPLSLADLNGQAIQVSSTPLASGSFAVRLRAVDQFNATAVDCNSFLTVSPGPSADKSLARRSVMPAAPIRN